MLNLLYFAWVKERMGRADEHLPFSSNLTTVHTLATFLRNRDEQGAKTFANPALIRAAVNQEFATPETPIHDNDEIAFFPPVTGG